MSERASWNSKLGLVLAAAGSAVGLGNLWRFPYLVAKDGGGTFLLAYLMFVVFVAAPMVLAEVALGISSKKSSMGAFKWISPNVRYFGLIFVVISALIISYYSVVGGWIIAYIPKMIYSSKDADFSASFNSFVTSDFQPIVSFVVFFLSSSIIIYSGVEKGIEKVSKFMMPVLFLLLVMLVIRSITLPNASKGAIFLFKPNLSELSSQTLIDALGQVFYSMSVGMGIYITYGSYYRKDKIDIGKTLWPVITMDTLVSILAGLAIFPAVFSFNIPMTSGPELVFVTLPKIFSSIPFGLFFGELFYLILYFSALTSVIALFEVVVSFLCDETHFSRKKATVVLTTVYLIVGSIVSLSFGRFSDIKLFGRILFDFLDYLSTNILLPISGLLFSLIIGYILGPQKLKVFKNKKKQKVFEFAIKFVVPISMIAILFFS
ncbi:MAG: sodium-dependent transporter [Alphaproteobacteria bacterium]|nr:sodium-dependent transporter [Alphaproteobacteria bacterium]